MRIVVTEANNADVAREVVTFLKGRLFTVSSFYFNGAEPEDPKALDGLFQLANDLPGGFEIYKEVTRIPLSPRRTILWSLRDEEVSVTFNDNDTMFLERRLPNNKVIFRMIIKV